MAFLAAMLLYMLGWSDLFTNLSASMIIFLILTSIIMMLFGNFRKNSNLIKWNEIEKDDYTYVFSILSLFGHLINFIFAGKIPLINILLSKPNEVVEGFNGIPFVHVLLVSFTTFYCTYLFHLYLSTKHRKDLLLYLINFLPLILLFSRSAIILVLMNCVWIVLIRKRKLSVKFVAILMICLLTIGYIFGVAGDKRTENQVNLSGTGSDLIMEIGSASEEFRESLIPKTYFWVYLYASSPLANFQHIINTDSNHPIDGERILEFVNNEFLPDSISNRINGLMGSSNIEMPLITPTLNVATIYGPAYEYLSWMGPILMFIYTIVIITGYLYVNKENKQFLLTGIAILNSIIVLNAFDNMFSKTAFSFQLVYPIAFGFFYSKTTRSLSWKRKLSSLWQRITEKCTLLNK